MSPTNSSTPCCRPRRSPPTRSRTSSRCSTRWASTWSSPRRPTDDDEEKAADEAEEEEDERRARRGQGQVARHHRDEGAVRAHRRSGAHVSARDGLGGTALARGRNRHRQAHRGRPRGDDRGPLRKPADLPGHHHLARRTQRRQGVPARHHRSRSDLCRPRRQEHPPATIGRTASRSPAAAARRCRAPRI